MPQHARTTRACRDCDGFASAAITTGTRHRDGTRVLVHVDCPTCQGTGHLVTITGLVRAGR
ncbi:hypothetical protein OG616_13565 [Streptomyces antibioticus]|uniref:hypothetical protein n=1 Tax=Streptomyces antibioticus TaxID=1890 RepID=UPI00225ADF2D|nr:hypothetical protein [Streptomyces antibioticus]MCX5169046.1 hypothetical protein [Streptomyces antibioticus]